MVARHARFPPEPPPLRLTTHLSEKPFKIKELSIEWRTRRPKTARTTVYIVYNETHTFLEYLMKRIVLNVSDSVYSVVKANATKQMRSVPNYILTVLLGVSTVQAGVPENAQVVPKPVIHNPDEDGIDFDE